MRRADFLGGYESNRAFMKTVAARIIQQLGSRIGRGLGELDEEDFLLKLTELEYLTEVTGDYECPIVHSFCNSRKDSCEGLNGYCWIKKQENGVAPTTMEDESDEDDED
jgi:hypothetical protein